MPIPDFQTALRPAVVAIEGDDPKSNAQIRDSVATALKVSDDERKLLILRGKQELLTNSVARALTHNNSATRRSSSVDPFTRCATGPDAMPKPVASPSSACSTGYRRSCCSTREVLRFQRCFRGRLW